MSRGSTWTNEDGLQVGFGTRQNDNDIAAKSSEGVKEKVIVELRGTALTNSAFAATDIDPQAVTIPRGSVISAATLQATEAWTGTGTLTIGTWSKGLDTEVVDDADGIDAAVDVDVALAAIGDIVQCDGALVGGAVSAGETANSDVVIAPRTTGTVSTGKAVLTVEYIAPRFNDPLAV